MVTPDLDMVGGGGGLQIFVRGTWYQFYSFSRIRRHFEKNGIIHYSVRRPFDK